MGPGEFNRVSSFPQSAASNGDVDFLTDLPDDKETLPPASSFSGSDKPIQTAPSSKASPSNVSPSKAPLSSESLASRSVTARAALEKAKKALALQKQIQEQIAVIKSGGGALSGRSSNVIITAGVAAALKSMPVSKPLRFDRLGREIDAEGKVVEVKPLARSTLKVNINKEREAKLKQVSFQARVDRSLTNPSANPFFDPSLPAGAKVRKKGLSFVERGFYSKKQQLMRTRELASQLGLKMLTSSAKEAQRKQEAAEEATLQRILRYKNEETEIGDDVNPNLLALGTREKNVDDDDDSDWIVSRQEALHLLQRRQFGIIPDVEWWDQALVKRPDDPSETVDPQFPYIIIEGVITHLIEHPVPLNPVVDLAKPMPPVLHLTPKERAKLRRRKRQEKEKDKRDKIRMGLIPPPPPKVKLANLSRVLGTSAASDPSKVEKEVRSQAAERYQAHLERNRARQLDPEQKRKKTISKWTQMPGEAEVPVGGAEVCVFSVADLSDTANLFKVDKNAQQFHVTGAAIICPQIGNLVIAEGSHKALKGYKKLLLRRVKWNSAPTEEKDETAKPDFEPEETPTPVSAGKGCKLLWEGVVKDRAFKQWKVYPCKSESEVKKILSDRNTEHYWEMLKKYRDPELDF